MIGNMAEPPTTMSFGDPPSSTETEGNLRTIANGKANSLHAELTVLELVGELSEILHNIDGIIAAVWHHGSGMMPQE